MTAKEKAKELCKKYYFDIMDIIEEPYSPERIAKRLSKIAVEEIIQLLSKEPPRASNIYQTIQYWQEVKQEIEKL